jgi:hypothetical protein
MDACVLGHTVGSHARSSRVRRSPVYVWVGRYLGALQGRFGAGGTGILAHAIRTEPSLPAQYSATEREPYADCVVEGLGCRPRH